MYCCTTMFRRLINLKKIEKKKKNRTVSIEIGIFIKNFSISAWLRVAGNW